MEVILFTESGAELMATIKEAKAFPPVVLLDDSKEGLTVFVPKPGAIGGHYAQTRPGIVQRINGVVEGPPK